MELAYYYILILTGLIVLYWVMEGDVGCLNNSNKNPAGPLAITLIPNRRAIVPLPRASRLGNIKIFKNCSSQPDQ